MKTGAAVYIAEKELRELEIASSFLGGMLESSSGDTSSLESAKAAVDTVIASFYRARQKVNSREQQNAALRAAWLTLHGKPTDS